MSFFVRFWFYPLYGYFPHLDLHLLLCKQVSEHLGRSAVLLIVSHLLYPFIPYICMTQEINKNQDKPEFAIASGNLKYIGMGVLIVIVGCLLMTGGKSSDPGSESVARSRSNAARSRSRSAAVGRGCSGS